jgi:ectoine hydroxylase-related dioxygenase (phytanoyl-CoA dioxygenase family)
MFETLFGETAVPHARNIARTIFPQNSTYTTPAHQDYVHIKGTLDTWTAWIPAGDCPSALGGLAIVSGSHRLGQLKTHAAYGAGGSGVEVPADSKWVLGELACGDVLTFHSLTVHQGRDNLTPDRLRLSFDFRYQPSSHPIARNSMLPHMGWLTWDQIYGSWPPNDAVRYYWKKWNLNYV